jgi:hypothetical protein
VSSERVPPEALVVGGIYLDDEGVPWAVVGRDGRGAAMLGVPAAAPDWSGVLLEPDGGWYEEDRYIGHVDGMVAVAEQASCRECRAPLVTAPATDPLNHVPGCQWLKLAVRAVARGVSSPTGRWLRPPGPDDLVVAASPEKAPSAGPGKADAPPAPGTPRGPGARPEAGAGHTPSPGSPRAGV